MTQAINNPHAASPSGTVITRRQAGQWWAQPNPRLAYCLNLRWNYEMPAAEALAYIRRTEQQYPGFIGDFMGTLRRAVGGTS